MSFEPARGPLPRLREIVPSLSAVHVANAVVAFVFAASAPVAIILGVGVKGGLSEVEMASWIFAAFVVNSVLTIAVSLRYRMPLAFFWTIPGTVLVGPALDHLSFAEVVGAFHATGLLLLVLGLTGSVRRVMARIPMPIIMAMVAGVFLQFGLGWIGALRDDLAIALPMTAAFFLLPLFPRFERRVPAMIGVLAVGVAAMLLTGRGPVLEKSAALAAGWQGALAVPGFIMPAFSLQAMIELVIPLAVTVIAAQNAQGIAILQSRGHEPPINTITTACGVGSLTAALFGCVSSCLTGPVNAIISAGGERGTQYAAALAVAALAILFALFAPLFTALMLATPAGFIAALAGLALLRVLQSAFQVSFRGRFTLGALVTFLVTIADHAIFNIGAPFWGLVFGVATSWLLERGDFAAENGKG
ncbi:MAG: benzoate/H(+) symporter BenE family transporter [Bradyrhizobiaceae bacterium]|nr:benzoate/H(+) symporter BenE family transporter [Bradyrhizobiaceae bacterium]